MKLTLEQIVSDQPGILKLMENKLPSKIGYRLNRLNSRLTPLIKSYNEQRFNLIKELGEQTDVKTDSWSVKEENMDNFKKRMTELQKIEEEFEFEPLNIDELGDINIEGKYLHQWLFK